MFETFLNFVEKQLAKEWKEMGPGTRVFRQTPKYKKRFAAFGELLRAYFELKDQGKPLDGLEPLMVEAHRFMRFICKEGKLPLPTTPPDARDIDLAVQEAISILDEPLTHCVPLHYEAQALEILSFSAWKILRKEGLIKYCKHCKTWLNGSCRKHKEPTSVEDLFFCKKCHGWLENICVVHGAEEDLRVVS